MMIKKFHNRKGFTLIEVLVGTIVIGLLSLVTWMAVTITTKSGEMSRNRSIAVNLLQQSQEEVRRIAQVDTIYDVLENCQFPDPSNPPPDTCGLADISMSFPGYQRTLSVTMDNGSTELKRILTTVRWVEFNKAKQIDSLMLISRPPEPLPGNILGLASSQEQSSVPLNGVTVTIEPDSSTATYATTSVGAVDGKGANYNFADVDTGRFVLPAGTYTLRAVRSGFYDYTHPSTIIVPSNGEVFVPIELEPKPENATIFGNVLDETDTILNSFSGGAINLYQNGFRLQRKTNQRNYSFTISFDDTTPKTFTINTHDAFRAGFAYLVGSGGGPSCVYEYNREGYSSAVVQPDDSLICTNSYNGNSDADRITVGPGDNIQFDLPLVPVPEVTITGQVIDSSSNPISGATVRARWPRSDGSRDWRKQGALQTATTDANGIFSFNVPAVQGMFANSNPTQNYLQVWARGNVQVLTCCDILRNERRNSPIRYIGPIFPTTPGFDIGTLVISAVDEQCGNVEGDIIDDLTSNRMPGVAVNISTTDTTDATGHYLIDCASGLTGYRLERGNYRFTGSKNGYYTNQSNGNSQYRRRGSGGRDVPILTDVVTTYDARMWPRGFGDIEVTVIDQTTGQLMDGVDVVFNPYFGSNIVRTTSGGMVSFSNVAETWPPPSVPTDGYYNLNTRNHTIEINHDPSNYEPHVEVISGFNAGDTQTITIFLKRIGGV